MTAFAIGLLLVAQADAQTLRADATLVFDSHSSVFNPGLPDAAPASTNGEAANIGVQLFPGSFTTVTDRYMLVIEGLIVPPGDYTRYEVAITAGPSQRLEVADPFGVGISVDASAMWGSGAYLTSGQTPGLSYVGGTGALPSASGFGLLSFNLDGDGFAMVLNGDSTPGGFGFEAMVIGRDVDPVEARSGAFPALPGAYIEFIYTVGGDPIGDPGRFSFIVPEPGSLALLGLGGLIVARRRHG